MIPRDRHALRLGAITIGISLLLLRVIPWAVRTGHQAASRIAAERALLAETRALVTAAPGMEDSLTHLARRLASLAPRFLQGESSVEAQADLANRLSLEAERAHLTVEHVVPVPDSVIRANGALHRVTVQASLIGDLPELLGLVDSLGRDVTVLTPAAIRMSAVDPAAPPSAAEAIKAELTVTGWYFVKEAAR